MNADHPEVAPILDGLALPATTTGRVGFVEAAMQRQIDAMERAGSLSEQHAGMIALALLAAREADSMGGNGRPSGRAMMLTAVTKVFELLPEVEAATEDIMDKLLREIQANDDTKAPA